MAAPALADDARITIVHGHGARAVDADVGARDALLLRATRARGTPDAAGWASFRAFANQGRNAIGEG